MNGIDYLNEKIKDHEKTIKIQEEQIQFLLRTLRNNGLFTGAISTEEIQLNNKRSQEYKEYLHKKTINKLNKSISYE